MDLARQNLRCVDWEDVLPESLLRDTAKDREKDEDASAKSRKLRPGEKIDYFLSHSWHDDGRLKYEKLSDLAETFKRRMGRSPTFWIDKYCIDQDAIVDGLRTLPVNVMACKNMLVLCGPTYTSRLWCVWEVCTLFAFSRKDDAQRRLRVIPLEAPGGGFDAMAALKNFDADAAHCYDPNEEQQLRRVIDAVGKETFTSRIQEIGNATYCSMGLASSPTLSRKGTFSFTRKSTFNFSQQAV